MGKVGIYSLLLILGLVLSQSLPQFVGPVYADLTPFVRMLTMIALAFIMIHVGYEFDIDKRRLGSYAWDYIVAMTAATFPWIFCALYFVFAMAPPELWSSLQFWKEVLLVSRFAAPTSAGVLFAMLAAAGLSATWVFRKARVLAIFDDLDTILLLIPLQMLMVGGRWQLGVLACVIVALLWAAWHYLHQLTWPRTWRWVLGYAVTLAVACEGVYRASVWWDPTAPLHLEVLLPAFVLGCTLARPRGKKARKAEEANPTERRAATLMGMAFMLLAGLSMPAIALEAAAPVPHAGIPNAYEGTDPEVLAARDRFPGWDVIAWHVLALWLLSNLGKLFPVLCYRQKASRRERWALGISMFPRGEVGAGVLVIAVFYGVAAPILTAATLTLCTNLICTGLFIVLVRRLLADLVVERKGPPPGGLSLSNYPDVAACLRDHVGDGLDYAVYLSKRGRHATTVLEVQDADLKAISNTLRDSLARLGLPHNDAHQVDLWRQVLPKIYHSFQEVQRLQVRNPLPDDKPPLRLERLVLDVEVGGLLLAVVGDQGWIFAATLDQQAMNDGSAERALAELVEDVGVELGLPDPAARLPHASTPAEEPR